MKAILWDMDGTLVNTEHLWGQATYGMGEKMGRPLTAEVRAQTVGGTLSDTIRTCATWAGLDINDAMIAHWKQFMISTMEELLSGELEFRPGVPQLIAEAKAAGIPMALVTNTTRHGLLASSKAPAGVDGLFYGGGFDQLGRQALGAVTVLVVSFVASYAIGWALQKTVGFRVDRDSELSGVDRVLHAESAYEILADGSIRTTLGGGLGAEESVFSPSPERSGILHDESPAR